jgi:hypothetical protein
MNRTYQGSVRAGREIESKRQKRGEPFTGSASPVRTARRRSCWNRVRGVTEGQSQTACGRFIEPVDLAGR